MRQIIENADDARAEWYLCLGNGIVWKTAAVEVFLLIQNDFRRSC